MSARAIVPAFVAAMAIALMVCTSDASAQRNQGPPNALQGFSQNRDQPVKIQAASLEVREKDKVATFTGDVHVVNGDTELRSKVLTVFYDEDSGSRTVKADSESGGERQ